MSLPCRRHLANDVAPFIPFVDPGEDKRQAARTMLDHARGELRSAGDAAEKTVGVWRDKAPEKPDFWSQVGDVFSSAGSDVLHGLEDFGADVVNAAASFGNAAINHPGDLALTLGGMALTGLSAGGEGLGFALDATGVGAIGGVPLKPGLSPNQMQKAIDAGRAPKGIDRVDTPKIAVSNYTSISKTARRLTSMGVGSMAEPS